MEITNEREVLNRWQIDFQNLFSCKTGVKQRDNLSPTLFSIFANDLVHEINSLDLGVNIADKKLSVLLYTQMILL
jgi:hypothetical protein